MQLLAKHYAKHYAAQQQELSDDTVTNDPTNNKLSPNGSSNCNTASKNGTELSATADELRDQFWSKMETCFA
jgi:hypothetical protein